MSPRLQVGGAFLFTGVTALVIAASLLVGQIRGIDTERECGVAADVAQEVGGGPFYRNLTGEMIGRSSADLPGMTNCLAVFRRRGLAVFPASAGYPDWVGARFDRPTFQDADHATIVMSHLSPVDGRTETLGVERRGGRWTVVAHHRFGWPMLPD